MSKFEYEILSPVRHNGERLEVGKKINLEEKEGDKLEAIKAVRLLAEKDRNFDLADALQTLISENHDIAKMKIGDINKLLPVNVKRADVDEALGTISAGE